jgi:4-amino-4-deoxy-L-arabinose transferase-like glycosyltransferase
MVDEQTLPKAVWVIAGLVVVLLLTVSSLYGFHRDELYFVAAGRRLAFGYVDQPPLTPLLARAMDVLPGTVNPTVLRILPALSAGAVIVVTAMIARRFGGSQRSVTMTAFFAAGAGFFLAVGHLLSTSTFDVLVWAVVILLIAGVVDGADPRWWVAVGGVIGIGMLNKHIIVALVVALLIGLLLTPQRRILAGMWPWIGVAVALVVAAPNLIWQALNDWPQIEMARSLSDSADSTADYLLLQIAILSIFLFIPAVLGFIWFVRDIRGKQWRLFPIAFLMLFIVFLVVGGQGYYVAPLYLPLLAAGAVSLDVGSRRVGRTVVGLAVVGAIVGIPLALPIVPPSKVEPFNEVNGELGETYGWDQFVDQVEVVFLALPDSDQQSATILTSNYGQAGAIEIIGAGRLPQPVSGHNSYWHWGPPSSDGPIIGVGFIPAAVRNICPVIDVRATITNEANLPNDEYGTEIWVCAEPTASLASIWDDLRHYD